MLFVLNTDFKLLLFQITYKLLHHINNIYLENLNQFKLYMVMLKLLQI